MLKVVDGKFIKEAKEEECLYLMELLALIYIFFSGAVFSRPANVFGVNDVIATESAEGKKKKKLNFYKGLAHSMF
jgi:hypothetical protein